MVNPKMHERWTIALGESAELLATRYEITRERQDEFARASHHNAAKAWESGFYESWVVPVPGVELENSRLNSGGTPLRPSASAIARDQNIKSDITAEQLAERRPAFTEHGTVTAGNSSPLNDGAAAVLIASEAAAERIGAEPIARIAGRGVSGIDPDIFGIAPIEAVNRALDRAGIGWDDVSVVELNEAFASQSLACIQGWPELDPSRVNPNGGAIALGHPLGASGARVLGSLAHELRRQGGGWGVATLCIGVGQGLAVVLEGLPG
jgi:acetyl-CoA acetyltransferase family protein